MRFSVSLYLLASISFFLDLIDVLVRLYLRSDHTAGSFSATVSPTSVPLDIGDFTPYEARLHLRPYAIIASVHNADQDLKGFFEHFKAYHGRLWIIDDASTDETWDRLQDSGVKCIRGLRNQNKPGALKALLATLPRTIQTVVVIDPDSRFLTSRTEVERVLFEFQRSGMAALCPRITVRGNDVLSRLQRLEYGLSFSLGRKSLGDFTVTSGIAVYRRDALERALSHHSLSVYAEDLENALILLAHGERVYYDGRLVVETDGPTTVPRLFSQRVGWQFGLLRVYAEYARQIFKRSQRNAVFFYQYIVYIGVFVIFLHPLKVLALPLLIASGFNGVDAMLGSSGIPDGTLTNPVYFLSVYLKYVLLMMGVIPLTVHKSERRSVWPIVPLYPFYALFQILPSTVGYVNWISMRLWRRRVYHDHYQPASA